MRALDLAANQRGELSAEQRAALGLYASALILLDLWRGQVSRMEERLELASRGRRWGFRFGPIWLSGDVRQLRSVLVSGLRYRAYLTPRSKLILNLEPLGRGDTAQAGEDQDA